MTRGARRTARAGARVAARAGVRLASLAVAALTLAALALAALALAALAGCHASYTIDVDDAESGARLRRVVLAPESGPAVFVGWHDTELDAECAFQPAADERLRCLPLQQSAGELYEDASCTSRVVEAPEGCAPARFAYAMTVEPSCVEPIAVELRTIEVLAIEEEIVRVETPFALRDGECIPWGIPVERARRLTRIDPARFVAAETERGDHPGGPILRDRLRAQDGATQRWSYRDRARDATCSRPWGGASEALPCMPSGIAQAHPGGAACDERWVTTPAGCDAPAFVYSVERESCEGVHEVQVLELDAPVPEGERDRGDACAAPPASGEVYRMRPTDEVFPTLARAWRGEGRLQVATLLDEGGGAVGTQTLYWDGELEATCLPMSTAAGLRCVPVPQSLYLGNTVRLGRYFADAACTQPATPRVACEYRYLVALERAPSCPSGLDIVSVQRVAGTIERLYRRRDDGACVADEEHGAGVALQEVALESLARVERIVD